MDGAIYARNTRMPFGLDKSSHLRPRHHTCSVLLCRQKNTLSEAVYVRTSRDNGKTEFSDGHKTAGVNPPYTNQSPGKNLARRHPESPMECVNALHSAITTSSLAAGQRFQLVNRAGNSGWRNVGESKGRRPSSSWGWRLGTNGVGVRVE